MNIAERKVADEMPIPELPTPRHAVGETVFMASAVWTADKCPHCSQWMPNGVGRWSETTVYAMIIDGLRLSITPNDGSLVEYHFTTTHGFWMREDEVSETEEGAVAIFEEQKRRIDEQHRVEMDPSRRTD